MDKSDNAQRKSPLHAAQQLLIAQEQALASDVISQPANRSSVLIDAENDAEAIRTYLAIRCAKPSTRKTVHRDLRKLAVFMSLNALSSLKQIKAEHARDFQQWLMAPPANLCSGKNGRPPPLSIQQGSDRVPNPQWKPFRAPLSPVMTNQTVQKIKSMTSWLVNAGYLSGNPWGLLSAVTKATTLNREEAEEPAHRELPIRCINAVMDYLECAQHDQARGRENGQRRWCFLFYLYTAARISSGCQAVLDDLYIDRKGAKQLTLTVKGQGVRRQDVPWIPELEAEYHRYRQVMGLSPIEILWREKRRPPGEAIQQDQGPRHLLLPMNVSANSAGSQAIELPMCPQAPRWTVS